MTMRTKLEISRMSNKGLKHHYTRCKRMAYTRTDIMKSFPGLFMPGAVAVTEDEKQYLLSLEKEIARRGCARPTRFDL